jgi:hypothetical protein
MELYLGKDRICATTQDSAPCYSETTDMKSKGAWPQVINVDNSFSSPDLFSDLTEQKINCFGVVTPNRKGMPDDFRSKTQALKQEDVRIRTSDDIRAITWKDKRNMHKLKNIYDPAAECNFCYERGNALKPATMEDYNRHRGYIDKSDRMANSSSISYHTWKWMRKLFSSSPQPHNSKQPHSPKALWF